MIQDEIVIREYKKGDEVQINLLHNNQYGRNRGEKEWKWEFTNSPNCKSIFVVAEYKGNIIGTQAFLPIRLSFGESQFLTAKSEETLLIPEFRGQGIFQRLLDRCFQLASERKIALVWGFTKAKKPFLDSGFQILGKLKQSVLILDSSQTYQMYGRRISVVAKKDFLSRVVHGSLLRVFTLFGFFWFKLRSYKIEPVSGFRVVQISQPDERLDNFWREFNCQGNFYTISRTSDYLNWRIFTNPDVNYQLWAAIEDDRIRGYVILGRSKHENVGYITDFCVLDKQFAPVAGLLMSHTVKYFVSQGVAFIDAWILGNNLESKRYSSWLRRSGFLSLSLGTCMILKVLASDRSFPADPSSLEQWFITNIFSEGVE